jgi:hypothetical protein
MIMMTRKYGQLGNRLMLSAHLIAAAREYGVTFWNPAFIDYARYFPSTCCDPWCRYPVIDRAESSDRHLPSNWHRRIVYTSTYLTARTLSHLRLTRFPAHVIRLRGEDPCDLASESFASLARSSRPLLLSGWKFRSPPLLEKHAEAIRDFFRVFPENETRVSRVMERARQQCDMLVGVHIRHGDYAKWLDGRYFYSIPAYRDAMQRIADHLGTRRVAFFVCGNAKLRKEDFGGLNVHFGTGHLIEDMYAFARTDWLVGPPSTYTGWASFYGNVPLTFMRSSDEPFDFARAPLPHAA